MVNPAPRILSGRYEVGEIIGRGGMAEVHIGHDSRLGRTVAIKILRSDLARDPSFQVRFRREAQAAASLNHPAIVAVYDTGEDTITESGGAVSHVPFIVMEYVEGHTVRDVLQGGNAVPIEEALEITAGILSALEYSHNAGIVHRDIKPANVMLTPTGAVKVMDFGIARALADSAATMTQTQAVIGTAQYLSPEQARGDKVDTRSDLYSTGCLLYELLTGKPPFTGDSPVAVAYQHVREAPKPPSSIATDVPEILDAITLKALEKDRADRYSTAAEFRSAIEAAARGESVEATTATRAVPLPVPMPQSPATQVMPQQAPVVPAPVPAWQNNTSSHELLPDTEDEETSNGKKWLWGLLAVALLAALTIAAMLLLGGDKERITTVTMPDLKGLTASQAKERLTEEGFVTAPLVKQEPSIDIPVDEFIRSEPARGEAVDSTLEVQLWFSQGPSGTTVPDVVDFSNAEAIKVLEAANLKVNRAFITENSPDIKKGNVTKTDPAADAEVAEGSEITLYISDGFVQIPDITALSLEEAKKALDEQGLKHDIKEEETGDLPVGSIIGQNPAGGVAEQGTRVEITIAIPLPPVTIIDLRNVSQADAERWLSEQGLGSAITEAHDDAMPAGRVISTSPAANAKVEVGGTVNLVISKGPEPTPEPEPEPEETESPDPSPSESADNNASGDGGSNANITNNSNKNGKSKGQNNGKGKND